MDVRALFRPQDPERGDSIIPWSFGRCRDRSQHEGSESRKLLILTSHLGRWKRCWWWGHGGGSGSDSQRGGHEKDTTSSRADTRLPHFLLASNR